MINRKLVLAVCGAAIVAAVLAPRAGAIGSDANQTMYLTFSRAVELPGVSLGSGTYIFEVANPETSGDVVRVLSRDRSRAYFLGFTRVVNRPHNMRHDQRVSLGEAAPATAPRITAWWPDGEPTGRQFVYPR